MGLDALTKLAYHADRLVIASDKITSRGEAVYQNLSKKWYLHPSSPCKYLVTHIYRQGT